MSVVVDRDWSDVYELAKLIEHTWTNGKRLYICGNGGSAGNASHLANDFLYGVAKGSGPGIKVESLSANPSVVTCLANDIGYGDIFSQQIIVKAEQGDVLLALSGSGESENIIRAIQTATSVGAHTAAILGYSGGRSAKLAEYVVHFPINDMQIAEDLQLVVGHMCMQWLANSRSKSVNTENQE